MQMTKFKMIEKENLNSIRESQEFYAKNLRGAKRKASNMQCFYNTVIELMDEFGKTIAVKEKGGRWIETN
jgi:hypothetical protein